jgi:xylulokinase
MQGEYLLGIDIGTYESKGVITTPTGRVVASASVGHQVSFPRQGWAEHDAEAVWWHDFVTLCRRMLDGSAIKGDQIAGIGASTIAPCVLPLDRAGRPLRPAILYGIDTRAAGQVTRLEELVGKERIMALNPNPMSAQDLGPRVLWLQENEPHVWQDTDSILTGNGYLVYRLTGEKTIDIYTATASTPLFDIHTIAWSGDTARSLMPLDLLPRLAWSCEVVGQVTESAARETGLAAGTPVVAGTADAGAEALSTGLSQVGDLMVMYGSSTFFILKTDRLLFSDQLWAANYLQRGVYVSAAGMATGGSLTRWFRDNLAPDERRSEAEGGPNAYASLAEMAACAPLGANGLVVLPYFAGERTPIFDPKARGLVAGLTLSHTRPELYRAVLEAVGYGIRHNLEALASLGCPPRRCLAVGGGTRNPLWLQITSDIAGIEQYVPVQSHGACYGDAFLAAVGIGLFDHIAQVAEWVEYGQIIHPDSNAHRCYQPYYEIYRQLYLDTADTVHRLALLQAEDSGAE